MDEKTGTRRKARDITSLANVRLVETTDATAPRRARADDTKGKSSVTEKPKPAIRLVKSTKPVPGPDVAEHVSRRLKALYDDVLNQPIPDRFLDLLKELDSDGKK